MDATSLDNLPVGDAATLANRLASGDRRLAGSVLLARVMLPWAQARLAELRGLGGPLAEAWALQLETAIGVAEARRLE